MHIKEKTNRRRNKQNNNHNNTCTRNQIPSTKEQNPKYNGHVPADGSAPGDGALRGLTLVSSETTNLFM
ncbi:hypothetical protein J6590_074368 [Homalodisca vitripennis]|nr:hypothetical protein J6590_074368 [Homalodisca vitripennis]